MNISTPYEREELTSLALLSLLVITLLIPFTNKAFHIDDPLFLWSARQIVSHPLDFYGFTVNWYGVEMPMAEVTKNPPGASYLLALVASIFGWKEVWLHLAFFIPALAAALGTYFLAREFCSMPLLASAIGLLSPVFLVSSTTLMSDIPMLAFWIWAVLFWIKGIKKDSMAKLLLSSILVALGSLTKYFAMSLIPLLFLYGLAEKRHLGSWAIPLSAPLAVLSGYQLLTYSLYGRGLLLDAASYATRVRYLSTGGLLSGSIVGFAFAGGCLITALPYSFYTWPRRTKIAGFGAAVILGLAMGLFLPRIGRLAIQESQGIRWWVVIQLSILTAGGIHLIALAVTDLWKERDAESLLLFFWMVGTFIFAAFINWSVNGRSILPMTPVAGILVARAIEGKEWSLRGPAWGKKALALLPAAFISVWITWSDYSLANSARRAAFAIREQFQDIQGEIWFQGHWGFQYYMEASGGKPLDFWRSRLKPGDIVIVPSNNTNIKPLPRGRARIVRVFSTRASRWATTMSSHLGAGFYSSVWGPLPFAFGSVPKESYYAFQVIHPVQFRRQLPGPQTKPRGE